MRIDEYIKAYGIDKTKQRMFQYIMGDINELGSPSFCQLCRGVGDDNQLVIEVGS